MKKQTSMAWKWMKDGAFLHFMSEQPSGAGQVAAQQKQQIQDWQGSQASTQQRTHQSRPEAVFSAATPNIQAARHCFPWMSRAGIWYHWPLFSKGSGMKTASSSTNVLFEAIPWEWGLARRLLATPPLHTFVGHYTRHRNPLVQTWNLQNSWLHQYWQQLSSMNLV